MNVNMMAAYRKAPGKLLKMIQYQTGNQGRDFRSGLE